MTAKQHIGAHQRHLLRRRDNPLFPAALRQVDENSLDAARGRDAEELQAFAGSFRRLLEQATGLKPNEESEVLLELKGKLDEAYTRAASLGGEVAQLQQAVARLTGVIMNAIRQGAGSDPQALQELEQEQLARESHYRLLEQALVADLMRPDSPIGAEELVPTLLSEDEAALEAVLWLFEPQELAGICREARSLLEALSVVEGPVLVRARANLARLEQARGPEGMPVN